jgi:MHS family proline/betaine transporter-like MFS transporter
MVMNKALKVLGVSIGNLLEWYDFGIYGTLVPIISSLIFPSSNILVSILYTFIVFGVGFLFRPLGSVVFGHFGDKLGRRTSLLLTFWIMGFATLFTGLIPTYSSIGILSPSLFMLLRILQGFGAGGEWGGVAAYLAEMGGENRRGFYGSFQQAFITTSLLIGSLSGVIITSFGQSFVNSIGWRIPFIAGGIILIPISAVLRIKLPESELFAEVKAKGKIAKLPLAKAFTRNIKSSLFVLLGTLLWTVSFYIMLTYLPSYLNKVLLVNLNQSYVINSIGLLVLTLFIPIWGYVSDKIKSRKALALTGSIGFTLLSYPVFLMMQSRSFPLILFGVVLMDFFISFLSGSLVSWFAEVFPTNDRYSGVNIPYNIAVAIFGGFAPTIATYLIQITSNPISPVYYVITSGVISIIAYALMNDTAKLSKLPED